MSSRSVSSRVRDIVGEKTPQLTTHDQADVESGKTPLRRLSTDPVDGVSSVSLVEGDTVTRSTSAGSEPPEDPGRLTAVRSAGGSVCLTSTLTMDLLDRISRALDQARGPVPERPPTREKGVYAVWLDQEGWKQLRIQNGWYGIAYVGVAGGEGGLARRFSEEWRPKHSGRSSPRRTLGALLRRRLNLKPRPRPGTAARSHEYFVFGDEGEAALTDWIETHASFAYLEVDVDDLPGISRVEQLETLLIERMQPPLNLSKWRNPQKQRLAEARAAAAHAAFKYAAKAARRE